MSLLVAKAVKLHKPVFYATGLLHLFDLWQIKVEEKLCSWTLFKNSLIFWHWSHVIHCHYCKKSYPCSNECVSSLSQLARAGDLQYCHGYTWSVHIWPHYDELHLPGRRQLKGMFFMSQCYSQASAATRDLWMIQSVSWPKKTPNNNNKDKHHLLRTDMKV